ncbi:MAG: helix-turn-helix transcriptional regulator [Myxococcota bacterium]|nr:helix-turn-helix transcriptional regulator [Myxococcota bacterium]
MYVLTDDEHEFSHELFKAYPSEKRGVVERVTGLTSRAMKLASSAKGVSYRVGKAILNSPDHIKAMQEAGAYLKDLREIAGLTTHELNEALELKDKDLIAAAENGTAILSFELILRLAALVARHDPIPFIMKAVRAYNPDAWEILEAWGVSKIPLHIEREREFINIFRSCDAARELSDKSYQKVLDFTKSAFNMAIQLHQDVANPKNPTDSEVKEKSGKIKETPSATPPSSQNEPNP